MTDVHGSLVLHLQITGIMMAALAVLNLALPRFLRWRDELAPLSLLTRQVFQVHAFFIALIVALFAALLLTSSNALLEPTRLSRVVLAGLTIFWGMRMLIQWFYYSPALWRGHRVNTAVHCLSSIGWIYMTTTFAAALWVNLSQASQVTR
jgi:hypothetical protein